MYLVLMTLDKVQKISKFQKVRSPPFLPPARNQASTDLISVTRVSFLSVWRLHVNWVVHSVLLPLVLGIFLDSLLLTVLFFSFKELNSDLQATLQTFMAKS